MTPARRSARPPARRVLWWGLTGRCPRCGSGGLLVRWFTLRERCPRCGLRFEREPGYWTGAMAMSIGVVGTVVVGVLVVALAFTVPDVPVTELVVVLSVVAVAGSIGFYPISKTLWMAVDHAFLGRLDDAPR